LGSGDAWAASGVPLPHPRPAIHVVPPTPLDFVFIAAQLGLNPAETTSEPAWCDRRLEQIAQTELVPT